MYNTNITAIQRDYMCPKLTKVFALYTVPLYIDNVTSLTSFILVIYAAYFNAFYESAKLVSIK